VADDAVVERVAQPAGPELVSRSRLAWPDAAKAVCILLVVLGHVTYMHLEESRWYAAAGEPPVWDLVDVVLRPVRMPLFFAVSGFFAARALTRSWRASLRGRVVQNLYLHVLWLLVGFAVGLVSGVATFMAPRHASGLPGAALTGSTGLWYLYALALYFVLARATRSLPAAVPVGAAAVLAVLSFAGVFPVSGDTHSVVENLVWFVAGARFPDLVRRVSARPRPVTFVLVVVALVAVLGAIRVLDLPRVVDAVLEVPTRAGAVLAGILLAVLVVERFPRAASPLLRLGRRTLPVYALHGIVLTALHRPLLAVTEPLIGTLPHAGQLLLVVAYPVGLTLAIAWVCLAVQTLAQRSGAGWLFALPGRRRRSDGVGAAPA
jgi:uncharacterized membrane protein YcfT